MKDYPIISVIVPVFNVEDYLRECVESIVSQSIRQLQIILIDDGSKDSSGKICDEYANKDNRIEVIHQNNKGVSAARNAGLKIARGRYISFIDADDILAKNAYSNMFKNIVVSEKSLIIGNHSLFYDDCHTCIDNDKFLNGQISNSAFIKHLLVENKFSYLGFLWDKLFCRNVIENHQLMFDERIKLNEDRLFILEYMLHADKVIVCDEVIYFYRQRSTGVIQESRRNITVNDNEMTVLLSFNEMKKICNRYSRNLYYICSRKAFESALDLLNRVDKKDKEKIRRIVTFMWENSKICLKNPNYTLLAKAKILAHTILKK